MYASFFGLAERPFSLAPDPRYLYLGDGHREALAHLLYGLGDGGGFVQLTGEVGTGKTTVCRALLEQLPPEVDVAMIFHPRLTAVELIASVCDELGVPYASGPASPKALIAALSRALLDAHARGRRTVLIIDEAQNLGLDVLEELRLLTNLETTRDKLLHVILIGQPELVELLQRPQLRQLAQRVTARYHLRPFAYRETRAYVEHRMQVAGQHAPVFTDRALRVVHRRARGVPRLINTVCDRALLGAFAKNRRRVTAGIARRAAVEALGPAARKRWVPAAATAALVIAVLAVAVALGPARLSLLARGWASNVRLAAPAVVAPRAPTPAAPALSPPHSSLAVVLSDEAAARDRKQAFTALYAQWNVDYRATPDALECDYARDAGFRCLVRAGTWTVLRRLDVPAILMLKTPAGEPRYAVLTRLDDASATLAIGDRHLTVRLGDVEPFWDGDFVALWKPPALGRTPIKPGMGGRDVVWLRQRLDEFDGRAAAPDDTLVYDDDLKRRVVAFQHAHALTADGIVGVETLLRLATIRSDSRGPSLSARRP